MSETRFDVGPTHGAARAVLKTIYAWRGIGVARLMFTFEIASKQQSVVDCMLWLGGRVELPNLPMHARYLASFQPQAQPLILSQLGVDQTLQLTLDVTDRQLQLIEERRTAGGIQLDMTLSGYALQDGRHHHVGEAHLTHQVSQSDWIALLEQAGYHRILLLELVAPDPQAHPDLTAAIEFYIQAQHRFSEGEWRLTVESLRQALSSLVGKKADDEEQEADIPDAIRVARRVSREGHLGYEPRLELVRQAAKFLCDLGAHPEVAETRRHHAYGALVFSGGLLHAFAETE